MLDGILVTTIERTVIDLAASIDLKSAVAAADRAIHIDRFARRAPLTTRQRLTETYERMLPFNGSARAHAVIMFASEGSGSPEESGSRVNIALNGFPEPELQHPFTILDGRTVEVDFFWREQNAVGECDGRIKYFDDRILRGSSRQAVYDEKVREDAIREQVRGFVRWDSQTGRNQHRLRVKLLRLGLPLGRPRLTRR